MLIGVDESVLIEVDESVLIEVDESVLLIRGVAAMFCPQGPLTDVWIQCEEPGCMKWRRISAAQFETLDKSAPWFCHLNPDPAFRQCIVPQEDATYEEKLAHKLGVKYIISSLPEGSLVLAKMTGFKGSDFYVSSLSGMKLILVFYTYISESSFSVEKN